MSYLDFLKSKMILAPESGFDVLPKDIHPALLPHQRDAVVWAIKGGRRAMFECMTSSPKELAKWLDKICNGRGFSFDNQYCKGDCDNPEECQHELECIEKWLIQPMEESI